MNICQLFSFFCFKYLSGPLILLFRFTCATLYAARERQRGSEGRATCGRVWRTWNIFHPESAACVAGRSGHPPPLAPRRGLRDIFNSGKPLAGNISFSLDILSAFFRSEKKCVAHMRRQRQRRRRHSRNIYYVDVAVHAAWKKLVNML